MPKHQYILCVDDDKDDFSLLKEAMERAATSVSLKFINSGDMAVRFLVEAIERHELPGLIILDINMPGLDGRRTLIEINKILPVYVPTLFLTTTPRKEDIEFGVSNTVTLMAKPTNIKGYDDLVLTVLNLFFESRANAI